MPNKNYLKGVRKEMKIVHQLEKDGFIISQRSAGSHSPIDIFAVHKEARVIKFIQAKPEDYPKSKQGRIMKEWGWLNGIFRVGFYVV